MLHKMKTGLAFMSIKIQIGIFAKNNPNQVICNSGKFKAGKSERGFLIKKKNWIIDFVCRFHIYSVIAIISITSHKKDIVWYSLSH